MGIYTDENIAAVSTPPGKGGVAIIRLSGATVLALAEKMFFPSGKTEVRAFEPYRMYPGRIDCGGFSDYGLMVYFRAPKSYTGEDVVEFHCHGGEHIARGVLKRCFDLGARSAEKGEFTRRAFLNGKLSLASAEGVADMIDADSEAEVKAGYLLYEEKLTSRIREVQSSVKTLLAGVDASMDYPEEDLEETAKAEVAAGAANAVKELSALSAMYGEGKKIKTGVSVAICGKPNTGKSSLLNRLLGYDKAIVSSTAGTTRDAVEGTIELRGVKFNLYDTAGVRESFEEIESIGISRAEAIIKSADVVVFVADLTRALDEEDARALEYAKGKPLVKVYNKTDLTKDETPSDADVHTSAVTGEGIKRLKELLYEKGFGSRGSEAAFVIEERHYNALRRGIEALKRAAENFDAPLEILASDLKEGWDALGEITGETASEKVIEEIFSKFCVGK